MVAPNVLAMLGTTMMLASLAFAQNATTIRYMPLGDSITEHGCWRAQLFDKLTKANYTVDFVGSASSTTVCEVGSYDNNHEGHTGNQASNIAKQSQLAGWLQSNPADLITMHLGTVDIVEGNITQTPLVSAFTNIVRQMRASNPKMKIIIAQIIPWPTSGYNSQILALNRVLPAWARAQNRSESPIWLVDQNTGFTTDDLIDGFHPNPLGDTKIANKYYPAIVNAIEQIKAGL